MLLCVLFRSPNSIYAHVLLTYIGKTHGSSLQNQVAEMLFQAYFTDGIYPSIDNVMRLISNLEVNHSEIKKILVDQILENEVKKEAKEYAQHITGVPYFIINNQHAVSGAQDSKVFTQIFDQL